MVNYKREIAVSIGIIINQQNEALVSYRSQNKDIGDCWEFPGGKVEESETPLLCLKREILEEVDLKVDSAQLMTEIQHDYSDKIIQLHVWKVLQFTGIAKGAEGQAIQWVAVEQLPTLKLPEANRRFLGLILNP